MPTEPKKLVGGVLIADPQELIDFYQLGDFQHQFQNHRYVSKIGVCRDTERRDNVARRVSTSNPIRVVLIGKPVPRDTERFRHLSPDRPAVMPAGFRLPSPEEMGRMSLDHMLETQRRGIDGN